MDSKADLKVLENRQTNEVKHKSVPHRKEAKSTFHSRLYVLMYYVTFKVFLVLSHLLQLVP